MAVRKTDPKEKSLDELTEELARSILNDILKSNETVPIDQKIDALKVLSAYSTKAGKGKTPTVGAAFDAYRNSTQA